MEHERDDADASEAAQQGGGGGEEGAGTAGRGVVEGDGVAGPASGNAAAQRAVEEEDDDDESDSSEESEEEFDPVPLIDRVMTDPTDYAGHVECVTQFRAHGLLSHLRDARERFAAAYPLAPRFWCEWLEDERKFGAEGQEGRDRLLRLCERAVADYLSVDVWNAVLACVAHVLGTDAAAARRWHERALQQAGTHFGRGAEVWTAVRAFEAVLQQLGAPGADAERVMSLFKRQAAVPLQGGEALLQELDGWAGTAGVGDVAGLRAEVAAALARTKRDVEARRPFEQRIARIAVPDPPERPTGAEPGAGPAEGEAEQKGPPGDELLARIWRAYVQHEAKHGTPQRMEQVYERALTQLPLRADLWEEYCGSLLRDSRQPVRAGVALHRAHRNCPWHAALWVLALEAVERARARGTDEEDEEGGGGVLAPGEEAAREAEAAASLAADGVGGVDVGAEVRALGGPASLVLLERALARPMAEVEGHVEVCMQYCAALRARLGSAPDKKGEFVEEEEQGGATVSDDAALARTALDSALRRLSSLVGDRFGSWPASIARMARFAGHVAAVSLRDGELVEAVWSPAIAAARSTVATWMEYASALRLAGDDARARSAYKQAVAVVRDAPELACNLLESFELERGSLRARAVAAKRLRARRGQIATQRSKEAQQQAEQQAQWEQREEGRKAKKQGNRGAAAGPTQAQAAAGPAKKGAKARKRGRAEEGKAGDHGTASGKADSAAAEAAAAEPDTAMGPPPPKRQRAGSGDRATAPAPKREPAPPGDVAEPRTVFVRSISFDATDSDLRAFMADCGEVREVRLKYGPQGRHRGLGYVEFATQEAADRAVALDGKELLGRPLGIAHSRPPVRRAAAPTEGGEPRHPETVFVTNIPASADEAGLRSVFGECGTITHVHLVPARGGSLRASALVQFETAEQATKAIGLTGRTVGDRPVEVVPSRFPADAKLRRAKEELEGRREARQPPSRMVRPRSLLHLVPRALRASGKDSSTSGGGGGAWPGNAPAPASGAPASGSAGGKSQADFRALLKARTGR